MLKKAVMSFDRILTKLFAMLKASWQLFENMKHERNARISKMARTMPNIIKELLIRPFMLLASRQRNRAF
jgi:hypothetical protein